MPDLCTWLPLTDDEEETGFVLKYLLDLITA